jgi:hypothetical protein
MSEQDLFRKPEYHGTDAKTFQDMWNGYVNTVGAALRLAGQLQTYKSETLTDEQMNSMMDAEHCFKRAIALSTDVDIFLNPEVDAKPVDLRTRILSDKYSEIKAANDAMLS